MTPYFFYRTVMFYVLEHLYLFWRFRPLLQDRQLPRRLAPLWFAAMGLFPLVFLWLPADSEAQRLFGRVGGAWQTFAYFCMVAFLFLDVLRVGVWLKRRLFSGRNARRPEDGAGSPSGAGEAGERFEAETDARPGGLSVLLDGLPRALRRPSLALIALGALFFAYGLHEARDVGLTRLEVVTDKLPRGVDRLRLAFASDLHVSPRLGGEHLQRVVDMIMAQKPDCILLGGDMLDDALQGTPADFQELGRLRAPLGTFAVLGNHEAFGDAARPAKLLREAGINVLSGQEAYAGALRIIGVDDPQVSAQKNGTTHNPMSLLRRVEPKRFTILLDHRPKMRRRSIGLFDLQLSGHSHGGQVFVLAPVMRAMYGAPSGLSVHDSASGESLLFISTGVGFSKLPIRLFVPPEVAIIDLVRKR